MDPEDNGDPEKVTYTCPGWFDDETDKFKFHGKKYSATELSFAKMKQLNTSAKESSLEHRKKKRKQLVAESTNISTDKKKKDNLSPKRKKHKKVHFFFPINLCCLFSFEVTNFSLIEHK